MKMRIILASILVLALVSVAPAYTAFDLNVDPSTFGHPTETLWDGGADSPTDGLWFDRAEPWAFGGDLAESYGQSERVWDGTTDFHLTNVTNTSAFSAGTYAGVSMDIDVYMWGVHHFSAGNGDFKAWLNGAKTVGPLHNHDFEYYLPDSVDGPWSMWKVNLGKITAEGDITIELNNRYLTSYRADIDRIEFRVNDWVPEPATLAILGLGGLAALIRRKRC